MTHVTPQTAVTPRTAAALKAAGFPQPLQKPAIGQVWYNAAGTPYHITAADGDRCDYVVGGSLFIDRYLLNEVFAPTAEDILHQLGVGWGVRLIACENGESFYSCTKSRPEPFAAEIFNCCAETCAAAYLETRPDA